MVLFFRLLYFTALASALWPVPVEEKHGDSVLFVRDIHFQWYQTGANELDPISRETINQFLFATNSNRKFQSHQYQSLRKHYTKGDFVEGEELEDITKEDVSDLEIINYATKSAFLRIFLQNFYPWKFHSRNWAEPIPPASRAEYLVLDVNINLLSPTGPELEKHYAGDIDESYKLSMSEEGKVVITSNSSVGVSHALTTLTQLFYSHSSGPIYSPFAPVEIYDAPQFSHRGINLDVSRNYFPVRDIVRQIDACAHNKLNKFHLHVTDGQSWPLEVPSMPELSAKGAYRPDLVYTAEDFKYIQHYGALRGVEVITEIDMPGHTSSIHHAFPELIAAFDRQPDWNTSAAEPPSGTLKLNSSKVYDFLEKLFEDVLPRVSPYTGYFHTGGDEVNQKAYELDETVKSSDPAVLQPLMQTFIDFLHSQVRKKGLVPMVWEEMLLQWNLTLGEDVVVQSWRSDDAVRQIVEKEHKVLVGNYKYWYLDCGKGQWLNFDPSISGEFWPYNDYCAPFHNWRLIYSYDPYTNIPEGKKHLVLGGEAHMWAEQTDPVNVDRMIWPRAAAVAEILWSGAKDGEGRNRSQIEASPRLSEMRERLVAMGVGAEPIQMPYCTMEGMGCQLGYSGDRTAV